MGRFSINKWWPRLEPVNEGLPENYLYLWVQDLAVDSVGRIYATLCSGGGVYRSNDDGLHWNPINNGLTNLYANCITIAPNGNLFVGTNSGLFRSSDSGDHWSRVNQDNLHGVTIFNTIFSAHNGNIFTSCAYSVDNFLFRSTDNGESWSSLVNGIDEWWPCAGFTVDPNGDLFVASGAVYRSTNYGDTWIKLTSGPNGGGVYSLAIDSSHAVLASTSNGIFRTTDHGNQWSSIGLSTTEIRSMAVRPNGDILAGPEYRRGVFHSSDTGVTWAYSSIGYYDRWSQTYSLAVCSPNVFAGSAAGVLSSTDEGTSWSSRGLLQDTIMALALDSTGHVLAGTHSGNIYTSVDNGSTWNPGIGLPNDPVLSITADSSGNLFAGTATQTVFRSTDHGAQWFSVGYGLSSSSVLSLTTDQRGFVFAGTSDSGVFRSSNNGISWSSINSGLTNLHVASIVADNLSLQGAIKPLYAGTDGGVYRSTDNGNTWNSLCLNSLSISSLLAMRDTVLIGTNGYGTYRFPDTSAYWGLMDGSNGFITALGAIRRVHYFASTIDNGVYQIYTYDTTASLPVNGGEKESLPVSFVLNQNYPNPFNPSTTIEYTLPMKSRIRLHVFNILGQQVTTLYDGEQLAGYQRVQWNANVSSGIYFYRIEATAVDDPNKHFVDTKKMLLLR